MHAQAKELRRRPKPVSVEMIDGEAGGVLLNQHKGWATDGAAVGDAETLAYRANKVRFARAERPYQSDYRAGKQQLAQSASESLCRGQIRQVHRQSLHQRRLARSRNLARRFQMLRTFDNTRVNENKNQRWLVIETSGRSGQVGLAYGASVCAIRTLDAARRHARDLAPAVGELLAGQGWKPRDLAGVIVNRGPGSYTGLRVGIMSAKAFAYATGCALITVDSLAAVAAQAPPDALNLDVIGDAQQDNIYLQSFRRQPRELMLQAVAPLTVVGISHWLEARDPGACVTGPGLHRYRDRIPRECRVVDARHWDPMVDSLLRLGLERFVRGERDDPAALGPLYLRPSSAEEQWARRQPS
jgi:tRNA threonylcarbamoyladenosine biosynthesis protein TsaB